MIEIRVTADELVEAMDRLSKALGGFPKEGSLEKKPEPQPEQAKENEDITLEQVRAVLADKSQEGKQVQVRALIHKYGATKLTEVDPFKYADLIKEAQVL